MIKRLMSAILSAAIAAGMCFTSLAYDANNRLDINTLDTDHIILIVGTSGTTAVTAYNLKRANDKWTEVSSADGVCGYNGITENKIELDKKTPEGVFNITMLFGLKDSPFDEAKSEGYGPYYKKSSDKALGYHKIVDGDVWVGDSSSKLYNTFQNLNELSDIDFSYYEDMIKFAPYYNYGIAIDYNKDRIPHKGSAIFVHCFGNDGNTGSAGCIRLPEEYVKNLLLDVDKDTKIVILSDASDLVAYK